MDALCAVAIASGTAAYWLSVPVLAALVRGGSIRPLHLFLNGAAWATFIVCLVLLATGATP